MTRLAHTTSPALEGVRGSVLAVPVGALEQHGPHLPLSTDTDIAVALADELATRRNDVLVAPALAFGASGEHQDFPGTISIGQEALAFLLIELVHSATHTFEHVLLVNGHGGNHATIIRATEQLQTEGRHVRTHTPNLPGDAHAGWTETSVMLHLHPNRVDRHRAEPGDLRPLTEVLPVLRRDGVRRVSPNGVLGDPRGATADDGQRIFETAAAALALTVDEWLAV